MKHTVSLPGYEIIELLEEYCFSTVYKIKRTDKALADKYFALKVFNIPDQFLYNNLKSEGYSDNDIKKQAEETVKTLVSNSEIFMGNLPNIINYESYIIAENETGYTVSFIMELLDSLSCYMHHNQIDEETATKLGMDICNGLKNFENQGIAHGAVTLKNIFVDNNKNFMLGSISEDRLLNYEIRIGHFNFYAPEIYSGKPHSIETDIYSSGLVLYYLMNKKRLPFDLLPPAIPTPVSYNNAKQRRYGGEQIPPPIDGSLQFKNIILKACAYNPEDRYHSADEFYNALGINRK